MRPATTRSTVLRVEGRNNACAFQTVSWSSLSASHTLYYFHVRKLTQLDPCSLYSWQTQENLQPSIKITISLTKNLKGILKRCIHSLSESRTRQCLQEQKPDREHVGVNDPLNPHPSPANHTGNRTGLDLPLQTVEFEAAMLQQLFILKGKLLSGKSSLLRRSDWSANTTLQGPGGPSYFLGAMLQLPEALGKLWRSRKGFISAPGWFVIHKSVVFPSGGGTGCLQMAWAASTLAALLVRSARQFQRGLWKLK